MEGLTYTFTTTAAPVQAEGTLCGNPFSKGQRWVALNQRRSKEMTYQTLQTLSQVAIAVGLTMTGLGGYGAYYYQKKIDAQRKHRSSR